MDSILSYRRLASPTSPTTLLITLCFIIAYILIRYWKRLRDLDYMPGYRPFFPPISMFGVLPTSWWHLNALWAWDLRSTSYFDKTHDIISIVPVIHGFSTYSVSSLNVAIQLLGNGVTKELPKATDLHFILLQWGENVFAANGETWKRHRRVMGPAFSRQTYDLLLEQITSIYKEMLDSPEWNDKDYVELDRCEKLTQRVAFLAIARCGYGLPLKWEMDPDAERAGDSHVQHVLANVMEAENFVLHSVVPSWAYKLPIQRLKSLDTAWRTVSDFMHGFLASRAQKLKEDPSLLSSQGDIFTRLVAASEGLSKYELDVSEVIGNTFLLMFAGNETSAMVLSETIAFLALYQEDQEKVVEEMNTIIGDREPTVDLLQELKYGLACFAEATRLYPPGPFITRTLPEDVMVTVEHPKEEQILLKKGTTISFDMITIHRNPNTFEDPNKFKPSRWQHLSETKYSMFGFGPRACIGRKFAQIETLAFLTLLLKDWKVDVVLNKGETREEYEERVMEHAGLSGVTFGVLGEMKLKFTRRG